MRVAALDQVAVASSMLCAGHCLLAPLAVGALPLAGMEAALGEPLEWTFVVGGLALGSASLIPSFRRLHRRWLPLMLFGAGVALWMGARLLASERWELLLVVTGAASLATAHLLNRRWCRACRSCGPQDTVG
jgi:hypothetical protein